MIIRKSAAELDKMRRSGRDPGEHDRPGPRGRGAGRHDPRARPGRRRVDRRGGRHVDFLGYRGRRSIPFPATICASINDEIVHGIPSADARASRRRPAVAGLRRDLGGVPLGLRGDRLRGRTAERRREAAGRGDRRPRSTPRSRWSAPAGGCPTSATRSSRRRSPRGVGVVREYGGHGIGRAMHEDPFIQNWGPPGRGPELKPGPRARGGADAQPGRRRDAACSTTAGPSSPPTDRSRPTSSTPSRSPTTATRC